MIREDGFFLITYHAFHMSEERKKIRRRVVTPRELLLVEVERYCREATCAARNAVGLTKEEARAYTSFTCERCERVWPDELSERDIPEWWEELRVASLEGLRPARGSEDEEAEGAVARLSAAWREGRGALGAGADGDGEDPEEDA